MQDSCASEYEKSATEEIDPDGSEEYATGGKASRADSLSADEEPEASLDIVVTMHGRSDKGVEVEDEPMRLHGPWPVQSSGGSYRPRPGDYVALDNGHPFLWLGNALGRTDVAFDYWERMIISGDLPYDYPEFVDILIHTDGGRYVDIFGDYYPPGRRCDRALWIADAWVHHGSPGLYSFDESTCYECRDQLRKRAVRYLYGIEIDIPTEPYIYIDEFGRDITETLRTGPRSSGFVEVHPVIVPPIARLQEIGGTSPHTMGDGDHADNQPEYHRADSDHWHTKHSQIEVGMERTRVEEILGAPEFVMPPWIGHVGYGPSMQFADSPYCMCCIWLMYDGDNTVESILPFAPWGRE